MEVIVKKNYEEMSKAAATLFAAEIMENPKTILGMATGSTPVGLYKELVKMYEAGDLDFSQVTTFNLDEYIGLAPEHDQSYHYFMNDNLFNHVDMDKLMDNLLKLNNESLNTFTHFIRGRYDLSHNLGNWIHETDEDIKPLEKLKEKVDEVSKTEKYIRKAAFMNLSKSLDGAIKRCKGDLHASPF